MRKLGKSLPKKKNPIHFCCGPLDEPLRIPHHNSLIFTLTKGTLRLYKGTHEFNAFSMQAFKMLTLNRWQKFS